MNKIEASLKTSDGELIKIKELTYRIGSFEGVCNYVIKNEQASPIHGVIEYKEKKWYIQDTNSAAGITINGKKITPNTSVLLNQNDEINIVGTRFDFIMDLDLFVETDLRLLNDLYKSWLFECDEKMQNRYRTEIIDIINKKLSLLALDNEAIDYNTVSENKKNDSKAAPMDEDDVFETEVLNGDEGELPTSVLTDSDGEMATTVLNEDDELATTLLSEEEGNMATTVLDEEDGDESTTVLNEEDSGQHNNLKQVMDEDENVTVVLQSNNECVLERVNSKKERIEINTSPFIIGKAFNQVNYVLDERGISRRHARIIRGNDDASYYIADLDSKNGTYLNGKRLIKDSVVKMKDGDMVSFAEYNYIVIID